jgi:hypothetical protein
VIATIDTSWGERIHGEIRCWHGRRWVEIETSDGSRHIGRLSPDEPALSTVDSADQAVAR